MVLVVGVWSDGPQFIHISPGSLLPHNYSGLGHVACFGQQERLEKCLLSLAALGNPETITG